MGPNLFVHNENSAYVMPRDTAHAVMSYAHHVVCAWLPLYKCGMPEITYGHAMCAS